MDSFADSVVNQPTLSPKPLVFSGKARTLAQLEQILESALVPQSLIFSVAEWRQSQSIIVERAMKLLSASYSLIVRSSARSEDCFAGSMAGQFLSIPNIATAPALVEAIDLVIQSYREENPANEVLVQAMLRQVSLSGVAFSKDPNSGADYIVINYDDRSTLTNTVTSGSTNDLNTYYHFKSYTDLPSGPLGKVIKLVEELEILFGHNALDIEFAFENEILYLLQVRPLIVKAAPNLSHETEKILSRLGQRIALANQPHPFLFGERTVFGVMPDWNPAEIIGIRPRALALSLYKDLVTDSIWAYQRDNYGYKNLRSFPLLLRFSGLPYIDVRVSFNSFIPADVPADLSDKLANYYIQRLIEDPALHDKVEFEIVLSCYTLDLQQRLEDLGRYGFTSGDCDQLTTSLRELTNRIIHGTNGLWAQDLGKIKNLEPRRQQILSSSMDKIGKIYWLLEDCKRYGTLPFAGLARSGFIAVQMLRSMIKVGIITPGEYEAFMRGLDTISSSISTDFAQLTKEQFLEKYGHLRPGTYDITSPRYDEDPDRYFDWHNKPSSEALSTEKFSLSLGQFKKVETLLKEHGLDHNALGLFEFIKSAIEGREYAKFVFCKNLSDCLTLIKELGEDLGFSPEQCSYLDITTLKSLYANFDDTREIMHASIAEGRRAYETISQIILPPIITKPEDVWAFHIPESSPNYITLKAVRGHIAFVENDRNSLKGSIAMIPSADPGYDWVFSHGIAGLVTKYGGVNSHMAIRAGELGIPAVIGAGEVLYNRLASARSAELDCMAKQVRIP